MKNAFLMAAVAAAIFSSSAHATTYIVTGVGSVDRIASLTDGVFDSTYDGTGSIALGDEMQFSFTFDTNQATLTTLFDADPTVNVYYLNPIGFSLSIGAYTYTPSFSYSGDASLQTWNDRVVVFDPVDSQSFSFFGRGSNSLPFDLGEGTYLESITLSAFDNSASARKSDLVSEIIPYTAFNSRRFSWLEYNTTTNTSIHVSGSFMGQISNSAVPEPATWMMMILGFGVVGSLMRRARNNMPTVAA